MRARDGVMENESEGWGEWIMIARDGEWRMRARDGVMENKSEGWESGE